MSKQTEAMRSALNSKSPVTRSPLEGRNRPSWLESEPINVNPNSLDLNPLNKYPKRNKQALEEFAAELKANGVVIPLILKPGKKGRYVVIAGEDRTKASLLAGITSVPAILVLNKNLTVDQEKEIMRIENEERKPITAKQKRLFVDENFGEEIKQDNRGKKDGKNLAKRIAESSRGQISEASAKKIIAEKRKKEGVAAPKKKPKPVDKKKVLQTELKEWRKALKEAERGAAAAKKKIAQIEKDLRNLK